MPILNKACIYVDLRAGSEYIGWVGCVLTILRALINVYCFSIPSFIGSHLMLDIIICLAHFLVSVCLVKAAKTNNHKLVIVWLVGYGINLVLINVFNLVTAFQFLDSGAYSLVQIFVMDTIGVYLWLCVYSFYQLLAEIPISERKTVLIKDAGTTRV